MRDRLLFGASVHPNRPDAIDELNALMDGKLGVRPVLLKWIPSSQGIDPKAVRYDRFYSRLAHWKLPLLCHTGTENSIKPAGGLEDHRDYDDPLRLVTPLEQKVTVIAAHGATPSRKLENA
jgi:uncharacterized protein